MERGEGGTSLDPRLGVRAGTETGDEETPGTPGDMDKASFGDVEGTDGDAEARVFELEPTPAALAEAAGS